MDKTGVSIMQDLVFQTYVGTQIKEVIEPLAQLRMAVFREFPYLYEGNMDYEKEYLSTYAEAERAFLFTVFHNQQLIGATTAIPLKNESNEVKLPFEENDFDLNSLFYFGESILQKDFRGLGIGHTAEPADYRSNEIFWVKRGYHKEADLKSYFEWPDIGAVEQTAKPMIYWIKRL